MTKQLINIGTIANDKTGDPLRTAFSKINTNFAEIYNVLGNGTALTLSSAELNALAGITSNIQEQLDNKLNATVLAPVATSNSYSDLINKPTLTAVAVSGSYNDLINKPSLFSGSYDDLINKPNLFNGQYSNLSGIPQFSQVAFTGSYNDLLDKPIGGVGSGNGLQSRALTSATVSQLANGASQFLNIAGSRGYVLYKISSSVPAWIRIYVNTAARNGDVSRTINVDPTPDSGVITEVVTAALNETVYLTPGIIGFNDEGPQDTDIYVTVTNVSGVTADITVSLTHVAIEQ